MRPFTDVMGTMVSLPRPDIDTDQIIPQIHLKRVERSGYGKFLFDSWAADDPDFVLNDASRANATILVAGPNFGCGSSREHAVWAIQDRGFDVVIAESFADIFSNNAANNGLLLVRLAAEEVSRLHHLATDASHTVEVSLEDCEVRSDNERWSFAIDPEVRRRLLAGLDMIGVTLEHEPAIAAYEAARS